MLEFDFMRRALAAGFLLSIMIPLIGVVMVNRKTSMVGDALSHTSLAGVACGLILGIDPVIGAVIVCIVSALSIEGIRKKFPHYGDMATAVIMSMGLGIAAVLSNFAPGGNTFESYLFGSISSVTQTDLIITGVVFVLVVGMSVISYSALLDIAIDPNLARLAGVNVSKVNGVFTVLTAITVALACKIVGALLVASLLVLPVATALLVSRSYASTVRIAVLLGIIYTMAGIVISYYWDIKPGGVIVLNAIAGMIVFFIYSKMRKIEKGYVPLTEFHDRA